jgi:hypothetical protein
MFLRLLSKIPGALLNRLCNLEKDGGLKCKIGLPKANLEIEL